MPDFVKEAEERMHKTLEVLKETLSRIRTGRANPAILSDVKVEAYGSVLPLKQVASILVPDPRTLQIRAYDRSILPQIEKAILKANLGLNPNREGESIRIFLPPLNEESRRNLLKIVKRDIEESKVGIRNIRRDIMESMKSAEKAGEITEDDYYRTQEKIQKLTDSITEEMDTLYQKKEKEILEG